MKSKKNEQSKDRNAAFSSAAAAETAALREDFKNEIQDFLDQSGLPQNSPLSFHPEQPDATPVYLLTGASFMLHDEKIHGDSPEHALYEARTDSKSYSMNNTATLLEQLMNDGQHVLVHSGNPDLVKELINGHPNAKNIAVIGGDLAEPKILKEIYGALEKISEDQPISTIKMALYQSFAQNNGDPFKPMHKESIEEVERAASKRLRFVYNMAAMGYDFVVNRNLEDLRIASLSALAANRASYGLLADASDKFMNELAWHTFHLEANISTGKPVTIYQVNPGITSACAVYGRDSVKQTVRRESIADGFPLDDKVLKGQKPLPEISTRDVAWVVQSLLSTPYGQDPNKDMPEGINNLLYGGFTRKELKKRFKKAVKQTKNGVAVDPDKLLPEHILRTGTEYGSLPKKLKAGEYKRISLSPPGQKF